VEAPVRYAKSGDVNIAYQVTGSGPIDLVVVSGFISHLDKDWDHPDSAHYIERMGTFSRVIRFDKRGTGLSDRSVGLPDLETRMDDVRAAAAGPGEVLVTSTTRDLVAGSGLEFDERGSFDLKGVGERTLYAATA
jgi:pimeloyl-ACP methyl ester carboxylesterase